MKRSGLVLLVVAAACIFAYGQGQEKVLWSFGSAPNDGIGPQGALVSDSSGNLRSDDWGRCEWVRDTVRVITSAWRYMDRDDPLQFLLQLRE